MSNLLQPTASTILIGAAALGAIIGIGSVAVTPEGRATIELAANEVSVLSGARRARSPQLGDRWSGCNDARAAGTAPIYRHEPGYRSEMDGDGDGIACEPYRR